MAGDSCAGALELVHWFHAELLHQIIGGETQM